ncbi:MAG TPA: universal stress protein [Candidatus Limnocylindria bacterium]|nr:universal stress protein [Candidatus Limnocylindria bacterium]
MRSGVAAIDSSSAARPVLSAATAVAKLLDARVDALHVTEVDAAPARAAADAAGLPLRVVEGEPEAAIAAASSPSEVALVVVGARGTPGGRRPAGHVATQLATSLRKPVMLVPPETPSPVRLRRLLVPLEAAMPTAAALRRLVELACRGGVEVVLLHVFDEERLPLFTDQPQHEVEAWIAEFLRSYCDRPDEVQVQPRAGVAAEHLLAAADEIGADALLLAWHQQLLPGRARLVRAALAQSHIPVVLVPVREAVEAVEAVSGAEASPSLRRTRRGAGR